MKKIIILKPRPVDFFCRRCSKFLPPLSQVVRTNGKLRFKRNKGTNTGRAGRMKLRHYYCLKCAEDVGII